MMQPRVYFDADQYVRTQEYATLKESAQAQGLYLFLFEYAHENRVDAHGGTYLIISPCKKYADDLAKQPWKIVDLVDEKRHYENGFFNPCYHILDFTEYCQGNDSHSICSDTIRTIQNSSEVINAFRSLGHDTYPDCVAKAGAEELSSLRNAYRDIRLPMRTQMELRKGYRAFAEKLYADSMRNNGILYRPVVKGQRVKKQYFTDNKITAVHERIDSNFLPYFLERVKDFPIFYYYMDKDPALTLPDLSHFLKGEKSNPFASKTEERQYDITFPYGVEDVYYGIMLEYSTRGLEHVSSDPEAVGRFGELETFRMDIRDMADLDERFGRFHIPYYVNHGEFERMGADAYMKPLVAVNKQYHKEVQMVLQMVEWDLLRSGGLSGNEVDRALSEIDRQSEANQPNRTIVGSPSVWNGLDFR